MSRSDFQTPIRRAFQPVAFVLVLIVSATNPSNGIAQNKDSFKLERTIEITELGDADVKLTIAAPTNVYTLLKTNTPNMSVLLRRLGAGEHWALMENVTGKFDDMKSRIEINYVHRNIARLTKEGSWRVQFEKDHDLDLIATFENQAIFNMSSMSEFGMVNMIVKINAPKASSDLQFHSNDSRLSYQFKPLPLEPTGTVESIDFSVESRPRLMSCMAKSYANEKFFQLWAARSVFENTGDTTLSNYRVRFRINGHSSWSSWRRSKMVLPGQKIVDPFFPVFDLQSVSSITGTRPITIDIEYEYKTQDGTTVKDSDARQAQLLAPNEAVFSSLRPSESLGFYDNFNYGPALMASYVTSNDPVMQQLAGKISQMAGGVAASTSDEEAFKYLAALYIFMSENRIAYQTPPGLLRDGCFGQHIKYGRDVLRNRAGTCVDLAILMASSCEAVGLRPVLVMIPGHAFPAVKLPSGRTVAVESTMVGRASFEDAVKRGMEELQQAQNGDSFLIDIREMRNQGHYPLDLPKVETDYLDELGYHFEVNNQNQTQSQNQNQVANRRQQKQTNANSSVDSRFLGQWRFNGTVKNVYFDLRAELNSNGRYVGSGTITTNGYSESFEELGTWTVSGSNLVIHTDGETFYRPFEFRNDGRLWLLFSEIEYRLGFNRI